MHRGVSEGLDDGGEEERVRVDGCDDGEEVKGEEDRVPVDERHLHPAPREGFVLDVGGGGGAVRIETHTRNGSFTLELGQESGVGRGVREEPACDQAKDDCNGTFDEEDPGPALKPTLILHRIRDCGQLTRIVLGLDLG